MGECCSSQSDPVVGRVVDRVKSLKEALAKDEVQSRSRIGADIRNNRINATGGTTNKSVEVTRPDLGVTS